MTKATIESSTKSVINLMDDNLFELKCLLKATGIILCTCCEISKRQLLAFITRNSDIGFLYLSHYNHSPLIKRIPWFRSPNKAVSALCFDPTGSWLLTVCIDGSLYIIPVSALLDEHLTDPKWSINDATHLSIVDYQSSFSRPCALTWWQGVSQCNHIGIMGTEEGEIVFINLENGEWIDSTRVNGSVSSLHICKDNRSEMVSLLITSKTQQQWRIILEQRSNGCIFSPNYQKTCSPIYTSQFDRFNNDTNFLPSTRSRLQGLKQLSVEKLTMIKQKLAESRIKNTTNTYSCRDKGTNSGNEFSSESSKLLLISKDSLTLEPLLDDTILSPQYINQGQSLYTAYCINSSYITIHGTDISVLPFHMYKTLDVCRDILLTQRFFFTIGKNRRSISIISCSLSETSIGDKSKFNPEAVIGYFNFENSQEVIINIYRLTDLNYLEDHFNSDIKVLPTKFENININVPSFDSCLVITNYGVYKIVLRKHLLKMFTELALSNKSNIERATRLGVVFGMDIFQLFEAAGDIHLKNNKFSEAAALFKLSKCKLLKGVLKTAAMGHTTKLLGCLNHCLSPPAEFELTTTTRIHLSNLTVFVFCELILRSLPEEANILYKDFVMFLSKNTFYDERWVVDVVGQAYLWKVLHYLATHKGLYIQVLETLIKTIQPYSTLGCSISPLTSKYGLLICISEPSFIQAMLAMPYLARSHMSFVLSNLCNFQTFVLQRLVTLYDPTNPAFRPLLVRYYSRRRTASYSSQSSQCDSLDSSEMLEENCCFVEEIFETFILILLTLISKKSSGPKHNPMLIGKLNFPEIEKKFINTLPNLDFKRRLLATGYAHVALIRNGNVYTWGSSVQGCLGTGPTISKYGPPTVINIFKNLEMEILSVSCGRCHTLAVTNNGVYVWGGSKYGQLGLGQVVQVPNPEIIASLAQEIIVDAVAGQYHSVALSKDGRVFTWGWGVHGQLGHGNTENKNIPTLVKALSGVVICGIAAGHAHTLVLSVGGVVYSFGCNIFGQLGIGNNMKSSIPQMISLMPELITDIAAGYFHNLAVSSSNKLYIWGSSPQVLRLQTQSQKKNKLAEFQAASEKYAKSFDELKPEMRNTKNVPNVDDVNSNKKLSTVEKLAMETANERKLNCPNVSKSMNLRDINLGISEETHTHLKPICVDTSLVQGRIVQISTGCHHSALLTKDGTVYCWGRNLDGQIGNGSRKDVVIPTPLTYNPLSVFVQIPPRSGQLPGSMENPENKLIINPCDSFNEKRDQTNKIIKAVRVCCGCEFTVAIQPGGAVLAWGSYTIAQLGRPPTNESGNVSEKLILIKSSKRIVRLPHGEHVAQDTPSQVPNIPTPIITYQSYDVTPLTHKICPLNLIEKSAGELTLHYVLEQFNGLYDTSKIMNKCDELENYQAKAKLALLEQNFLLSLDCQLKIFNSKNYKTVLMSSAHDNCEIIINSDKIVKRNTKLFNEQTEKILVDTFKESESKKKMKMSISRSLDSINILGQELYIFECQGGSEELCDDSKSYGISLDFTEDVSDNDNDSIMFQSYKEMFSYDFDDKEQNINKSDNPDIEINYQELNGLEKSLNGFNVIMTESSNIIKFYINEIDESMQKVLKQVLLTIFNFWIKYRFPMDILEKILLEKIHKLYYSLSLLIFCQNQFTDRIDADKNNEKNFSIINYVSTEFSCKILSLLYDHIDKKKTASEYIELFSTLSANNYRPSVVGYGFKESVEQIMVGIMSVISSKTDNPRPFIHIKNPKKVINLLDNGENIIVFTCGHHFLLSNYQTEIIPNMEAELLMTQPLLLPSTAQTLGNVFTQVCNNKIEIICPQCVPRTIRAVEKNLMDI